MPSSSCSLHKYFSNFLQSCVQCPPRIKDCMVEAVHDILVCQEQCQGVTGIAHHPNSNNSISAIIIGFSTTGAAVFVIIVLSLVVYLHRKRRRQAEGQRDEEIELHPNRSANLALNERREDVSDANPDPINAPLNEVPDFQHEPEPPNELAVQPISPLDCGNASSHNFNTRNERRVDADGEKKPIAETDGKPFQECQADLSQGIPTTMDSLLEYNE